MRPGEGGFDGAGGADASTSDGNGEPEEGAAGDAVDASTPGDAGDDAPAVACVTAVECPGDDGECAHRACVDGVCSVGIDPAGQVLASQTTGDCLVRKCDGNGQAVTSADDSDLPDDSNPCTLDACASGVASHQAAPAGTACGGTTTCNADGHCIGCTQASDCPGSDTACRTRVCDQGTCGFSFMPAATVVTDPTPGDCKGLACDAVGVAQVLDTPADVPSDDNPCTLDRCNGGTPTFGPAARGTACGDGKSCDGQTACVTCLTAATCPGTDGDCQVRTCTAGTCGVTYSAAGKVLAIQAAGDCQQAVCDGQGGTMSIADDTDVPVDNNPCTGDVCAAGVPSNPPQPSNTACNGNLKCDGIGHCLGCALAADCGTDTPCTMYACSNGQCQTTRLPAGTPTSVQTANDCKQYRCDALGGSTPVADDSDLPVDGLGCTADVCSNGTPSNPLLPAGTACNENGGTRCNGAGVCVQCASAADCGTDSECQKFTCSAQGMCGQNNPPVGTVLANQTAGDCMRAVCDGQGGTTSVNDDTDGVSDSDPCTQDGCSNGTAAHPPAAAGLACTQNGGVQCDGAGACGPLLTLIKINEVESNGGVPADWVELYNISATLTVDISGWIFRDSDDTHSYAIRAGTTLGPHAFLTLEEADFNFGLGSGDSARLFDASGTMLIDSYSWTSHAPYTYGRCPDGSGAFVSNTASTKGAANACP